MTGFRLPAPIHPRRGLEEVARSLAGVLGRATSHPEEQNRPTTATVARYQASPEIFTLYPDGGGVIVPKIIITSQSGTAPWTLHTSDDISALVPGQTVTANTLPEGTTVVSVGSGSFVVNTGSGNPGPLGTVNHVVIAEDDGVDAIRCDTYAAPGACDTCLILCQGSQIWAVTSFTPPTT